MSDRRIQKLIAKFNKERTETLNLIASENNASLNVLKTLGSGLSDKYAEGYPGKRYYQGNQTIDKIENLCIERALHLFDLSPQKWHINVQPYSGSPANLAVLVALVKTGDLPAGKAEKIMGLALDMGGHLTHGHKASITGKLWKSIPYLLDSKTERLDYMAIEKLALRGKPKLIIAGHSAYSRTIDFKKFRKIADKIGAYLVVDMSHIAGLVAGNCHPSPFPHADIVTTTTHKTLRGPRGAIIFVNKSSKIANKNKVDIAKLIDRSVFPGLQGGPHMNNIAGIAVALNEAAKPSFKKYSQQIIKNAQTLSDELIHLGWRVVSSGTDTHLFLLDTMSRGITGVIAAERLEKNGIIVNKNMLPYDKRSPLDPSGIRLGTPALTTRGMKEKEMLLIAHFITTILIENNTLKKEVRNLVRKFPMEL